MDENRGGLDLEATLQDAAALEVFRQWIRSDPYRSHDCLSLYFAIKGFKEYVSLGDPRAASMACHLHRKFISLRSGSCSFLPDDVRREMSERVHSLNSTNPPTSTLFEPVRLPLIILLRYLHSKFVRSDMFAAFLNRCCNESSEIIPCSHQSVEVAFSHQDCEKSFPVACSSDSYRGHNSIKQIYDCNASSSRYVDDDVIGGGNLSINAEKNLYRDSDGSTRHDFPEARNAFAAAVTDRLQAIVDELHRRGYETYARDLPKVLPVRISAPEHSRIRDTTSSDEEVEKYVGRIEKDKKRSNSTSPVLFPYQPPKLPNPYGENGFAPPPNKSVQVYDFDDKIIPTAHGIHAPDTMHGIEYHLTDSSGFCSAESAYLSEKSFGKGRCDFHPFSNAMSFSHTLVRKPQILVPSQSIFATLPRKPIDPLPIRLTMILRESDQPPMVAKVTGECITLAQFKKTFGISRKDNKRLLFKSECEDHSAPFQWSVIIDDNVVLPIFEGKITAECRRFYD